MFKVDLLAGIMVLVTAILAGIGVIQPVEFGEVVSIASCLVGTTRRALKE